MILPDDFEAATPQAEENIETTEVTEVEDTKPTEETQEQTEETKDNQEQPKIKVKYNHEEKELTLEEATLLAQKGMNYDKLTSQLAALQNSKGLQYLNKLASRSNSNIDDLVDYWEQRDEQEQLNQLIQANIPEEYAKEMLESRKFREQTKAQEAEKKAREAEEAKQTAELNDFINLYPDLKPDAIPKEVWDYRNQNGKSLAEAMMWHENKELKKQVQILKQNEENRKKALVGGVTYHGGNEAAQEDEFLKGFNSI